MSDNWNDDWRAELEAEEPARWHRLCEGKNTSTDLRVIAKLMRKYNPSHTAEEALDRTILWLTDWNNQVELIPVTEEYKKLLKYLEGEK